MKRKHFASLSLATAIAASAIAATHPKAFKGAPDPSRINDYIVQYAGILSVLQGSYVDSLEMDKVVRSGIDAMLADIDPYTEFYDNNNIEELSSISLGHYGGIGCAVQRQGDSIVVMSSPYYGSPSRNAGLRHGDILLAIDDYVVPSSGIDLNDITTRLKGNPGTQVAIRVRRPWLPEGSDSIFTIPITRDKIQLDPLPYYGLLPGGVAYFDISTFNNNTAAEIRKAFSSIKKEKGKDLKGVILDLRSNGGGVINGAIDLLSIFMDRNTTVAQGRFRDKSTQDYNTRKGPVDTRIPIVVLINGNSASASEIVAGAIQDLDRGVIMGSRSYGKGLIQTSQQVGGNALLKYTTGKYYLPSGRLIQALDYVNRNDDGTPALVADSLTTAYFTSHGREVRDGRGIAPDVALEMEEASRLGFQLYKDQWIDNFANRFRNTSDAAPNPADTIVTDELFNEFKAFVDPQKLKYGELSQAGIDYLRQAAKAEGLENDSVLSAIDNLERLIHHDLMHEIDANRHEIAEMLEYEIALRYFDDFTVRERVVKTDNQIEQARQLLLDPDRYRSLLLPTNKTPKNKK